MIIAVVGSGGKTTLIKKLAAQYQSEGKTVLITTTTHMFVEPDTLLTDDAGAIIHAIQETGYAMAGIPDGEKIKPLSKETFDAVCACADVVLVEADGSRRMPLKYPNATEPVIPENADEILVVCGLNAIGQKAKDVCHRLELVKACLGIDGNTVITPAHIQKLVTEGYLKPLRAAYPKVTIRVRPCHDGSLYQRAIASLLQNEQDVSILRKEWFCPQPKLILCGGGHVSREVAAFAHRLDFSVTVMDERPEAVTRERFPTAEALICDSYDNLANHLEPDACYVVVTPDHKADLQCVSTILPTQYRYLGMIGSRKKVASTVENLRNAGFTQEQIAAGELTMHDVLIVASLIEKEAANAQESTTVASVIYNRLCSKTYPCLCIDATIQYALPERKETLTQQDTLIDSPYNTYKYPGLPVGAISNPGVTSIRGALYPKDTEYFFYALGKSGLHSFFRTYSEHLAFQEELRNG